MERELDINPMFLSSDDVEYNNNTFSSFVDESLMMMHHPLPCSSSSSSWYPAETFHHAPPAPPPSPRPENIDENDQVIIGAEKEKKKEKRATRKVQRIAFHTRSDDEVLDDGYRWRKYGQKSVKNNAHPRSYYRCTYHTCNVKKQVQRLAKDSKVVVTTYEGIHNHPCEKLMETLNPLLRQLQFLSTLTTY